MDYFPIFVALKDQRVLLSGGGEAAIAKLRLLMKTTAELHVFAPIAAPEIKKWADQGKVYLHARTLESNDLQSAKLIYAADENEALDARTAQIANSAEVMLNVVDNLEKSGFITPAIVDRDPVTIAIGTEGASPVLARAIKADLEEKLPQTLGILARIGKKFRKAADILPMGRARRDFWRDYYFNSGAKVQKQDDIQSALDATLAKHLSYETREAHITFVGAGPGDPELLTLKARKAIDEADIILHDRFVTPEILELARREAIIIDAEKEVFGPSMSQTHINDLIAEHTQNGAQIVRLKSGYPTISGRLDEEIETCKTNDIAYSIIPGITAASAAVASIRQNFTRREYNDAMRLLTGHYMKGFADHDWASLAKPDAVAAIYMGKKAPRFVQGRLFMHGADRLTP